MQSNITPEEDEQLTHEKRVEEAEQADQSYEDDEDDLEFDDDEDIDSEGLDLGDELGGGGL